MLKYFQDLSKDMHKYSWVVERRVEPMTDRQRRAIGKIEEALGEFYTGGESKDDASEFIGKHMHEFQQEILRVRCKDAIRNRYCGDPKMEWPDDEWCGPMYIDGLCFEDTF